MVDPTNSETRPPVPVIHRPSTLHFSDTTGATHRMPRESIEVDKFHLLWVLERWDRKGIRPQLAHIWIPFPMFLSLLTVLISADFKDVLGFQKEAWQAVTFILVVASGIACPVVLLAWGIDRLLHPPKTSVQTIEEMIEEIERMKSKLATRELED